MDETGAISPDYYTDEPVETIEIIHDALEEAQLGPFKSSVFGNIIKYARRCDKKGQRKADIKKLANYGHMLAEGKWIDG